MYLLRLSLKLLRRDWRAGEWRVLLLALVLTAGSLATVGLFADRVRQALQQQAASLIGADLRITSTRPFSPGYRKMAQKLGLQVMESRTFPSMVSHGEQVLLAEIQAVEAGYPLRGKMSIEAGVGWAGAAHALGKPVVESGSIWADDRLMRRLNLHIGDEVGIGARHFKVAARVVKEVDQSLGFGSFAPRVLMNIQDLAATGLLQEGSRISYCLMLAGEPKLLAAFRAGLPANPNEKQEDVRDARPEIRTALERAEHFLGLAALTTAILAGAAMALAARRYVVRHLDGCAVMRCLGAQQGQVLRLFLYQFILLGLVAVTGGLLLGYVTQAALVELILHEATLPQPGALPAVQAAISGFALLFGFAFLPLLSLRRVSPLRVLRRELGTPEARNWLVYALALLVLAGLFLWQAASLKLGLMVLAGLLGGLLVFGFLAGVLLRSLARSSPYWRQTFKNLAQQGRSVAVQVTALSLGGMALLMLTLVRADLLESWQGKLPADAPNRFVVNIQPAQRQALLDFFAEQKLPEPMLLPMVKARLIAINAHAVRAENYSEPRARGLVEREFNLSCADELPAWNTLSSGKWWSPSAAAELSVEEGIARTLGIQLGDTLSYDVAGSRFSATVTSLRRVQWDSMKVNFFVIATTPLLKDYPASYLSSFYLPADKLQAGDKLVQRMPNLLLIDTQEIIVQVRAIIEQIAQTVSVVFLFTLLTGLVVLYAALLASQDERVHEAAILRTLGADSRYLRRLHLSEFAVMGLIAGFFAASGAALLGWLLARLLEIPYHADARLWLAGSLSGVGLVMLAGWLHTRKLLFQSPLMILRGE